MLEVCLIPGEVNGEQPKSSAARSCEIIVIGQEQWKHDTNHFSIYVS